MYPTKEEILAALPKTDVSAYLQPLRDWKQVYYKGQWRTLSTEQKLDRLMLLCYQIYMATHADQLSVQKGDSYLYIPQTNTIQLDANNASVISTLHELGHAICGYAEIDACRFSVKLFNEVFPEVYKKLQWKGHMLVK